MAQAAQLDPQNHEVWLLLAEYNEATGDWGQARNALVELTNLSPKSAPFWGRLAVAAARLEDETTTRHAVEQALRLNPDEISALGFQATLLARDKQPEKRLEVLRRLWQLQPNNLEVAAHLADSLVAARHFDEAHLLLGKIIAAQPDFAPAYAMRAEGNLTPNASKDQLKKAKSDLLKSLQLDSRQEKTRVLLAQLYARQKQWHQSIAQYKELLKQHEGRTIYWNELAGVYQKAGRGKEALTSRRRVAQIAEARDRRDALESRLANDPNHFENNLQMGLLLLRSPQPLNADKYIAKALRLRPSDARAQSAERELESLYQKHLQSGLQALQKQDIQTADREISRAMLLRPQDPRTTAAIKQITQAKPNFALTQMLSGHRCSAAIVALFHFHSKFA